jgi:hypothetical protein
MIPEDDCLRKRITSEFRLRLESIFTSPGGKPAEVRDNDVAAVVEVVVVVVVVVDPDVLDADSNMMC